MIVESLFCRGVGLIAFFLFKISFLCNSALARRKKRMEGATFFLFLSFEKRNIFIFH